MRISKTHIIMMLSVTLGMPWQAFAQKLLNPSASGGFLSGITASSGGANTSITLAYSTRQLKSNYDHTAITPPSAVSGFTNSSTPLLRVRRDSDNGQLDLGYDDNGNLDTVKLKNFVSNNGANPTANGFVSVWYDQSGNSYDALQSTAASQPRIVNAGVIEENGTGIPGIATISGSNIADGTLLTPPAGFNRYGITGDRTLNVISFPRSYANGNINDGAGTYVLDRTSGTGQDVPLTSIKASGSKWGLQIRNDANNIGSSFQGSINIGLSRSDNITVIRSSDTYSLEVNGIVAGSSTLTGTNSMVPVKIGYGSNTGEYIYYGELLLFASALSTADRVVLFKNQETYFTLGDYPQWTGAVSTDWNTAGNWSTNDIPTAVSKVTIPSGTARNLAITSGQTTLLAFKLTVNSGATMTIDGNLGISDSVNINGTVDGTGTITLNGANGQSQYIKGTMCGLTVNNTSAVVNASANITVNGILTTSSGAVLNLGTNTLTGTLGTITNNGTIRTFNTSSTPLASGKTWGGTGTVEYALTTGGQTVVTGNYYKMLLSNTSGTQTVSGDIGFPTSGGGLTTTSGGTLDFLTFLFSAPNSGMVFANNGKIRTACSNAFPVPLDISWGGTFEFYATGFQRVRRGSYTRLYLTNASGLQEIAGNITISDSMTIAGSFNTTGFVLLASSPASVFVNNGTILVGNTFTTPIPAGRTWGGTVNYNIGTGGQTIINGTYNNLTLSNSSGTQSLSGDLTVNGTLTFSGTGKVALGSNTLNINGALSGHTSSRPLVGNGSSNLVIGGSGALGSSLFFDQTTPGTTNRLNDFTYNRASQTITLGNALQVTGTVTPTAGALATGNTLTLLSTAAGTGRIAAGSGSYITGNITAERFIPSVARRWRFMASPVSGSTLDDWQNEIYITGTGGAANGFDATISNQAGAYYYNEATPGEFNANGWVAPSDINTALTPGKGFRIFIRGDRSDAGVLNGNTGTQAAVTMNVVGAANTGNVTMPISYTNSGNTANDGWSFLGNPYPSPIDWNAFHDAGRTGSSPDYSGTDYAHLDAVASVYDVNIANYASYNAASNIGTGAFSNGIIPSGGAFWVKASAASPSMTMKEIYKTGSTPAAMFKDAGPQPAFSLKLSKDEITADEMVVKYMNEATNNFDMYDIAKLNGEVNLSGITNDGTLLTGNCKPFNGISDSIRLNIAVAKSGNYVIEAANVQQLASGKNIYLVDAFAHEVLDLNTTSRYDLTIDKDNAASYGSNRFMLVVGDEKPVETGTKEQAAVINSISVYPALTNGELTISNTISSNEPVNIMITDAAGREVKSINNLAWNNNRIVLNLSGNKAGAYLITVQSASTNVVLKCIKY